MKNRFDLLTSPDDDIEKKYSNLIEANENVALSFLPNKQKTRQKPFYGNALVKIARKNFESAKQKHEIRATRRTTKALAAA